MEGNQMQKKRYTEEQIVRILGEAEARAGSISVAISR